jgi:hypothetical protein
MRITVKGGLGALAGIGLALSWSALVASSASADVAAGSGSTNLPLVLTGAKLKEYHSLYQDPFVLQVRRSLDRYLRGEFRGLEWAPVVKGILGDGTDGLGSFDKSYYKSKFIVIQTEGFLGGGKTVSIVFIDRPDRMFDVWIYRLASGSYEMRAFSQDNSFVAKEIQFVYRNLLADKKHAL